MTIETDVVWQVLNFECPVCRKLHAMYTFARACCAPEPAQVFLWRCSACGDLWDTEAEARACAASHPPLVEPEPISHEAIEAEKKRVAPKVEDDDDLPDDEPVEDV